MPSDGIINILNSFFLKLQIQICVVHSMMSMQELKFLYLHASLFGIKFCVNKLKWLRILTRAYL